jgi:DNA-binding beta-propeller fold protein YncE
VQSFSLVQQYFSLVTPEGLFFKDDGTKMYVIVEYIDTVYQYDLSTAWDISTASFTYPTSDYFSVLTEETSPTGLFFKDDGTKMYITGTVGDDVNEYSLSTEWNISTASYVQNFSVSTEETIPQGLFFKNDGTKMYIIGSSGDDVNEYSLSTGWDISTASYSQNFSVSTEETSPTGLFFKPDGAKMYITGSAGDDVNEYSLSTVWDISTASYVQNFSISAQDFVPQDLFFKYDGTKMYIVGENNNKIYEYSLSTAWDISTASYLQDFSVGQQEIVPRGLFFKPNGAKMYIAGSISAAIWAYSL